MRARKIISAALFCAFAAFAFNGALALTFIGGSVSLRYEAPLTASQVKAAVIYEKESESNTLSPTFWSESQETAYGNGKSVAATVIRFMGSANAAYGAKYLYGTAPGGDEYGCALSAKMAYGLFGSLDVAGIGITVGHKKYYVRGVFESRENLCLIPCGHEAGGFTAIELIGTTPADRRRHALAFTMCSGLPKPYQAVFGESLAAIATIICFLPLIAISIGTLWLLWRQGLAKRTLPKAYLSAKRQILGFCLAFAVALLLPAFLQNIPAWLLPSKWSDFAFWPMLAESIKSNINEWLAIKPCLRDVQMKYNLFQAVFFSALQLPLALYMVKINLPIYSPKPKPKRATNELGA